MSDNAYEHSTRSDALLMAATVGFVLACALLALAALRYL